MDMYSGAVIAVFFSLVYLAILLKVVDGTKLL